MTDIEKAADTYLSDRCCTHRINDEGFYSYDEMVLSFLAGAAYRDAEVEALKEKVEALRQMCGEIGDEWSCDVVDFANQVVQLLDKDSNA